MNDQQYYNFLDKLIPFPYPEHNVNLTNKQLREERNRTASRITEYNNFYKPENISRVLSTSFDKDIKVSKEYEDAYVNYREAQDKAAAELKKFGKLAWWLLAPLIVGLIATLLAATLLKDFFMDHSGLISFFIVVSFLPFVILMFKQLVKISKLANGSSNAIENSKKMAKEIANTIALNDYSGAKVEDICCYMKISDKDREYQIELEKKARKARAKTNFKLSFLIIAVCLIIAAIVLSAVFWDWVKEHIIYPALAIIILIVLIVVAGKKDKSNKQPGLIEQIKQDRQERAAQEQIRKQNMFYNNGGLDRCGRIPGLGEVVLSEDRRMINRIGSYEVDYSYSSGKINRIGPYEVTYYGDKIQRIGNMEVEYDGDVITRIRPL